MCEGKLARLNWASSLNRLTAGPAAIVDHSCSRHAATQGLGGCGAVGLQSQTDRLPMGQ